MAAASVIPVILWKHGGKNKPSLKLVSQLACHMLWWTRDLSHTRWEMRPLRSCDFHRCGTFIYINMQTQTHIHTYIHICTNHTHKGSNKKRSLFETLLRLFLLYPWDDLNFLRMEGHEDLRCWLFASIMESLEQPSVHQYSLCLWTTSLLFSIKIKS